MHGHRRLAGAAGATPTCPTLARPRPPSSVLGPGFLAGPPVAAERRSPRTPPPVGAPSRRRAPGTTPPGCRPSRCAVGATEGGTRLAGRRLCGRGGRARVPGLGTTPRTSRTPRRCWPTGTTFDFRGLRAGSGLRRAPGRARGAIAREHDPDRWAAAIRCCARAAGSRCRDRPGRAGRPRAAPRRDAPARRRGARRDQGLRAGAGAGRAAAGRHASTHRSDLDKLAAAKLWLVSDRPTAGPPSRVTRAACRTSPTRSTRSYRSPSTEVETMTCDEHWRLYVNPDWLIAADPRDRPASWRT